MRGWTYWRPWSARGATLLALPARRARPRWRGSGSPRWLLLVADPLGGADARATPATSRATSPGPSTAASSAVAPVVIARDLWTHPRVTGHTVAGALCVYLLVGMLFSARSA